MRNLLIFSIFISFLTSCKQPEKLNIEANLRYLSDDKKLDASFKISQLSNLTKSIKIEDAFFNDGAMERKENAIQGIVYQAKRDGKFPDSLALHFKHEQHRYEFKIQSSAIKNLGVRDTLAHKLGEINVFWQGEPLKKDESLTVLISDLDGTLAETKIAGATSKSEVKIPGAMFSGLKNGVGSIYVVKTQIEQIKTKELQGNIVTEFYSEAVKVKIIE
jgi:hypothetical protein